MRILTLFIFLLLTLFCFGQEHTFRKYVATFNVSTSGANYTLLLADNNEFLIYGNGCQRDVIYPLHVYYGKYTENHDTLDFYFSSLDSILIKSNYRWDNKLLFCGDTIFLWEEINTYDSFKYSLCIKKEDRIKFENTDLKGKAFFLINEHPAKYSFSIKGSLPISLQNYVRSLQFSLKRLTDDICIAYYTDINSSLNVMGIRNYFYNQDDNIDLFSLNLTNYVANSNLFIYTDKRFDNFIPVMVDVDLLLTDSINKIVLELTGNHDLNWKYLTRSAYPGIPSVKPDYMFLNEFGQTISIAEERQKLKRKIIKKDISYTDAYKTLIKSRCFDNKKFDFIITDSLPTEPEIVFSISNTFSLNTLSEIYYSFYSVPDSFFMDKKVRRQFVKDKSKAQICISNAGFNKNKTLCFLSVQNIDNTTVKKEILVFERRINEYVLTGKIVDGKYVDMLEGKESDYFPDMRNYRLFY